MAENIVTDAKKAGVEAQKDAEERARNMLRDARDTADGVRGEGLELVANLREMSGSLQSNAERLLRDIQNIHRRMLESSTQAMAALPGRGPAQPRRRCSPAARSPDRGVTTTPDGEVLDVPEFIP